MRGGASTPGAFPIGCGLTPKAALGTRRCATPPPGFARVGHAVGVRTARPPAALLPAPLARTVGFALLATLGAAEWARMIGHGGLVAALPWVAAAVLAGETVGAAGSLAPRLRVPAAGLAAALRLVLAALASGLGPPLLLPGPPGGPSAGGGPGPG